MRGSLMRAVVLRMLWLMLRDSYCSVIQWKFANDRPSVGVAIHPSTVQPSSRPAVQPSSRPAVRPSVRPSVHQPTLSATYPPRPTFSVAHLRSWIRRWRACSRRHRHTSRSPAGSHSAAHKRWRRGTRQCLETHTVHQSSQGNGRGREGGRGGRGGR